MISSLFLFLILFLLAGSFALTSFTSACRRLRKTESLKRFTQIGSLFFYRPFHLLFYKKNEYETLFFSIICAQNLVRFLYPLATFLWLFSAGFFAISWTATVITALLLLAVLIIVGDALPRIVGLQYPDWTIKSCAPLVSMLLFISCPAAYLFLKCCRSIPRKVYFEYMYEAQTQAKRELIEMIQNAELDATLDPIDQQVIESIAKFHNRVTREVMVPRVDVYALPDNTSIKEAARLLDMEGFSRIPVYKNNVDNIIGLLMYKDVVHKFLEYEQRGNDVSVLEAPIDSIVKEPFYTPETKKISRLLQEFRAKQTHMAVVVDEYGGTEGIITIEDILEEIVGEIADEYDEEETLYLAQPDGSWIVDARMNIVDMEKELGIKIQQEGDYDTLGGYLFHRTGSIPPNGFVIHLDEYELHVIQSDERSVEKVKIIPIAEPSIS